MRSMRCFSALALILLLVCCTHMSSQYFGEARTAVAVAAEPLAQESSPRDVPNVLQHVPRLPQSAATSAELRRILAQSEFLESGASNVPKETWFTRLIEQLSRLLRSLGLGTASWPGVVISLVLIAGLLVLIVRLTWELLSRRARHEDGASDGAAEHLSAERILEAAASAAARGDHREAIRCVFLALLRQLELRTTALLTNRQLTRLVAKQLPTAREAFGQLVTSYEDTWYGGLPCGAGDYAHARRLAGAVLEHRMEAGSERATA
jgi:hypothetical protein